MKDFVFWVIFAIGITLVLRPLEQIAERLRVIMVILQKLDRERNPHDDDEGEA